MTPEQYAYSHRLGELYDRLSTALELQRHEKYQALIDILGEYSYDDVEFMLNVIKEDIDATSTH
jgi:hypothetical protein